MWVVLAAHADGWLAAQATARYIRVSRVFAALLLSVLRSTHCSGHWCALKHTTACCAKLELTTVVADLVKSPGPVHFYHFYNFQNPCCIVCRRGTSHPCSTLVFSERAAATMFSIQPSLQHLCHVVCILVLCSFRHPHAPCGCPMCFRDSTCLCFVHSSMQLQWPCSVVFLHRNSLQLEACM